MNQKYVYGYQNGWNVENEYINSLNGIMDEYNAQVGKIEEIEGLYSDLGDLIRRNSSVTDEQIREWYEQDVDTTSKRYISFESYKQEILNEMNKKQQEKENSLSNKGNEYFANLYHLSNIKDETRKVVYQRKKELELLLSEKELELSSINLEQRKTGIQYDENHNVLNQEQLANLRERYDVTFLEIRKLEHALRTLDEMNKLLELTEEEIELRMRGLNPQERKVYDEIRKPVPPTPEPNPKEDENEVPERTTEYDDLLDMYNQDLETLYELQNLYENKRIEYSEYAKFADYMVGRYRYIIGMYEELSKDGKHLEKPEQPMMIKENEFGKGPDPKTIPDPKPIPDPEPQPEPQPEPGPETKEEQITLDGIIAKVCGNEKFNDSQSSRYAASKIKVFSKPQKNNLGLAYKIVSIPKNIIGIIPKAAMKIYGLFITNKTKDIFRGMEERANNLTDKEVEILLNEYKGATAQSKRLPKGFNEAIRPRVNLYVSKQVAQINEEIKNDILRINHFKKIIEVLKNKLKEENTPEQVEKIQELLEKAYSSGAASVKNLIALQVKGNNLQNGNGLHSFEEELKALNTKLNYIGGRFSSGREYDPELWSKISGYSQKVEYSLDPKEVFDAFVTRDQIYKENSKEKRSILNLGSKVTSGKLDYRPFVESLNYGNDPFIRDLITSVLVVSSAASLINNIAQNVKNNAAMEQLREQQELVKDIQNGGETIEKGIISDIKQTEGAVENFGERAIGAKYDWQLGGKDFKADDVAHHLETSNLSTQNAQEILDLTSKYSAGQISHAELLKGLQGIKSQTTATYETYVNNLGKEIEQYAASHPQHDYTAVLSAIKHAASNPGDSTALTDYMTEIYEKSLSVGDLSAIESALSNPSLIPDIVTLTAVTAKVSQEKVDSMNEPKVDSKRNQEIREMIASLRAMKAELTEEDIKEVEELLTR